MTAENQQYAGGSTQQQYVEDDMNSQVEDSTLSAGKSQQGTHYQLREAPRLIDPPDGGYGWVIVIASLMCNVIVDGICFSYSVFNLSVMSDFDVPMKVSAWVGSLMFGCYLIIGPFVSVLCNKYGCRRVTICGSVIACASLLLGTQSPNIGVLMFLQGVCGGIGCGMIYLPAIVIVGYWFEKRRAFATGIVVCGSGVGMFIFAPLSTYLIEEYKWQGGMAIIAGIMLNCAVCGALFRPLEVPKPKRMKRGIVNQGSIMKALIQEKKRQRTISNGSLDNCIITMDNRLIKIDQVSIRSRTTGFFPRLKETLGLSARSLYKSKGSCVVPSIVVEQLGNGRMTSSNSPRSVTKLSSLPSHMRVVNLPRSNPNSLGSPNSSGDTGVVLVDSPRNSQSILASSSTNSCNTVSTTTQNSPECEERLLHAGSPSRVLKSQSYDLIPQSVPTEEDGPWEQVYCAKPLTGKSVSCHTVYRIQNLDNVNFNCNNNNRNSTKGSIGYLPVSALTSRSTLNQRHRIVHSIRSLPGSRVHALSSGSQGPLMNGSVVSVPGHYSCMSSFVGSLDTLYFEEEQPCFLRRFWEFLHDTFDFTLLKSPMFAVLSLSAMLTMLGLFVPYLYLQPLAGKVLGIDDFDTYFLLSVLGVANTVGRVISGWVADRPWADALHINNTALVIAGVLTCFVPYFTDYVALATYAGIFGICIAAFVSLRSILLVDLLGLERLTNSFGLLILFQGIATMASTPLAGQVVDTETESYDYSFYFSGIMITISGLLGYPLRRIKRWEERKRSAKNTPSIPSEEILINEMLHVEVVETTI